MMMARTERPEGKRDEGAMITLEEIHKRRALVVQMESRLADDLHLPHTLLDMLEMLWKKNDLRDESERGEQLLLPNGRKLRKGGLKVSWGDFLRSIDQLKSFLRLMLPPSSLKSRSWLIKEPPFLPPKKPKVGTIFADQARKQIESERVEPFVPPMRHAVLKDQPSAPKLVRVPEKPVVELPHFASANLKKFKKQAERRKVGIRRALESMVGDEVTVKKKWIDSFRAMNWSVYSFEALWDSEEQKEVQREAVERVQVELTPIPEFVEPEEESDVESKEVFQPPEGAPLPKPIDVNDIVLSKPEILEWGKEMRDKYLESLLRSEVPEAKRFQQIGRLRIECASKWRKPAEFYSEDGRVVLVMPFTRKIRVHCAQQPDTCYHVQLICFTPGVELIITAKEKESFTIVINSAVERETVEHCVVIFRWRLLSHAWLQQHIYTPQESGRWTPQRAMVRRSNTRFWTQLPFPRLKQCPPKKDKMQDALDGDGIIAFAGLQLMKPCNPPYAIATTVAYSRYKALFVLCLSKKTQVTQTIKELLLQLLQPRHAALAQLFSRGGGLNIAVVGPAKGPRFYCDEGFLAPQAKSIESMRSWLRLQTVSHTGKFLRARKDVDTVLKWAAAKQTSAVHFLTAEFRPEEFDRVGKGTPFHVLCFGNRLERKEADFQGGTLDYIALGKNMHSLDEVLNLTDAKWSKDTTKEAVANEVYRRQHVSQENMIRLENRLALRQATRRFEGLHREASQAEEAIIHQDGLRAIIWQWQSIADVALLRARTTLLNLFLAAATVRKKESVRKRRAKVEQERTNAVSVATECLVHLLDTVLLDVLARRDSQFKCESTRIQKHNEELVRIAKEEFDARMDPELIILEKQRKRREYMRRRDERYQEHLRLVESIQAKNSIVEKEGMKELKKAKLDVAIPEIHQVLLALNHKDQVVHCLRYKFRILGRRNAHELKPPANLVEMKRFVPITSHEAYRKNILAQTTLQAQSFERELHALEANQETYFTKCLKLVDEIVDAEQKVHVANCREDILKKVEQFKEVTIEARETVTSRMQSLAVEHGPIVFTGWKIAPDLPFVQELQGGQHLESALRRRRKARAMIRALESLDMFLGNLNLGLLDSISSNPLPQCVSETDFSIPLNVAAFKTIIAQACNSAISAVKACRVLESADSSAFALAACEREKLKLEAWHEIEVFPLTFENKARLLLYELKLDKASKGHAAEYDELVAAAKKEYDERTAAIQQKNKELLDSCIDRDREAERQAEEDYKSLSIKAQSDFSHNVLEPIRGYNTEVASMQKRADAARKELTLVERFENELMYSVPKTKLARKVAECTVREALQRAFKPHVAGSALHAVNTKTLPKPFTLFA